MGKAPSFSAVIVQFSVSVDLTVTGFCVTSPSLPTLLVRALVIPGLMAPRSTDTSETSHCVSDVPPTKPAPVA